MKTVGVVRESNGLKDFHVTYNGETHVATRVGTSSRFSFGGFEGTLAQCKEEIRHFVDSPEEQVEAEEESSQGLWDCVPPAVLLAMIASGRTDDAIHEINRTLDAFGLIKSDGEVDAEEALRAFRHHTRESK